VTNASNPVSDTVVALHRIGAESVSVVETRCAENCDLQADLVSDTEFKA
jgi:hypothetical protein